MITLNVNGQNYQVDVPSRHSVAVGTARHLALPDWHQIRLRHLGLLGLRGHHQRAGGQILRRQRREAAGKTITTIEGLDRLSPNPDSPINRLQQSLDRTPGAAVRLLPVGHVDEGGCDVLREQGEDNPTPSDSDINDAMKNICVCGTYQRVRAAIKGAANWPKPREDDAPSDNLLTKASALDRRQFLKTTGGFLLAFTLDGGSNRAFADGAAPSASPPTSASGRMNRSRS